MASPRIGLALGSGSARGWSHIGVIEGLAKAGIHADIVCGCSIGALVGAAYVAGAPPALKDFAQSLTLREIARFLDIRLSGGGLIGGREIVALLRKNLDRYPASPSLLRRLRPIFAPVGKSGSERDRSMMRSAPRSRCLAYSVRLATEIAGSWMEDLSIPYPFLFVARLARTW